MKRPDGFQQSRQSDQRPAESSVGMERAGGGPRNAASPPPKAKSPAKAQGSPGSRPGSTNRAATTGRAGERRAAPKSNASTAVAGRTSPAPKAAEKQPQPPARRSLASPPPANWTAQTEPIAVSRTPPASRRIESPIAVEESTGSPDTATVQTSTSQSPATTNIPLPISLKPLEAEVQEEGPAATVETRASHPAPLVEPLRLGTESNSTSEEPSAREEKPEEKRRVSSRTNLQVLQGLLQRTHIMEDMLREAADSSDSESESDSDDDVTLKVDEKLREVLQLHMDVTSVSAQLDKALQRQSMLEKQSRAYAQQIASLKRGEQSQQEGGTLALALPNAAQNPNIGLAIADGRCKAALPPGSIPRALLPAGAVEAATQIVAQAGGGRIPLSDAPRAAPLPLADQAPDARLKTNAPQALKAITGGTQPLALPAPGNHNISGEAAVSSQSGVAAITDVADLSYESTWTDGTIGSIGSAVLAALPDAVRRGSLMREESPPAALQDEAAVQAALVPANSSMQRVPDSWRYGGVARSISQPGALQQHSWHMLEQPPGVQQPQQRQRSTTPAAILDRVQVRPAGAAPASEQLASAPMSRSSIRTVPVASVVQSPTQDAKLLSPATASPCGELSREGSKELARAAVNWSQQGSKPLAGGSVQLPPYNTSLLLEGTSSSATLAPSLSMQSIGTQLRQVPAASPPQAARLCHWPSSAYVREPAVASSFCPAAMATQESPPSGSLSIPTAQQYSHAQRYPSAPASFLSEFGSPSHFVMVSQDASTPMMPVPHGAIIQTQSHSPPKLATSSSTSRLTLVRSASVGSPSRFVQPPSSAMAVTPMVPGSPPVAIPQVATILPVRQRIVRRAHTSSPIRHSTGPAATSSRAALPIPRTEVKRTWRFFTTPNSPGQRISSPPRAAACHGTTTVRNLEGELTVGSALAAGQAGAGPVEEEATDDINSSQRAAAAREAAMALFDIIDRNHDGVITRTELETAQAIGTVPDFLKAPGP
mmetsp:Transcript_28390/g.65828  ORF Transcript_28390/g.65828 Transcript_28390/m.65828 type:complete len:998 (-) Transcript_28390:109-3102(-)